MRLSLVVNRNKNDQSVIIFTEKINQQYINDNCVIHMKNFISMNTNTRIDINFPFDFFT